MSAAVPSPSWRPSEPDRVILYDVSWRTYQSLLADYNDCQTPRLTFDRGKLEILVTLSSWHEESGRALSLLVDALAAVWGLETRSLSSMTMTHEDRQIGTEPDSCFYIASEPIVRGRYDFDFRVDPPPDLVIDIDLTDYWLDRFPVYAGLGVPEIWRYDGSHVQIFELEAGSYYPAAPSQMLPPVTSEVLSRFVDDVRTIGSVAWWDAVCNWASTHRMSKPA